jgi:hypothetical protein
MSIAQLTPPTPAIPVFPVNMASQPLSFPDTLLQDTDGIAADPADLLVASRIDPGTIPFVIAYDPDDEDEEGDDDYDDDDEDDYDDDDYDDDEDDDDDDLDGDSDDDDEDYGDEDDDIEEEEG